MTLTLGQEVPSTHANPNLVSRLVTSLPLHHESLPLSTLCNTILTPTHLHIHDYSTLYYIASISISRYLLPPGIRPCLHVRHTKVSFLGGRFESAIMSRQDQVVDDDEPEVCPLCIEELDPTDIRFRPCPCGYQVSFSLPCSKGSTTCSHSHFPRSANSATTISKPR